MSLTLDLSPSTSVVLETADGLIRVERVAGRRFRFHAPPAVVIHRPGCPRTPRVPARIAPPSAGYTRAELVRALGELARSEGRSREDTRRIDAAGNILRDLIRRLDPREPERRSA
jgi:hypothetical protein